MHKLKAYAGQKVLSWGLSVFPLTEKDSPQTEVGHSISRKFAAQLPDLALHFLGLFLTAFLERQGFILADKRTKKDVLVGFLRPGVASQVTHARLASAWSQRHLAYASLGVLPQTARSRARMIAMKLPGLSVDNTPRGG